MPMTMDVGSNIRKARELKGLSQKELAGLLKKHYHRVIAYEKGRVTLDMVAKIGKVLGMENPWDLLRPPTPTPQTVDHGISECVSRVIAGAMGASIPADILEGLAKIAGDAHLLDGIRSALGIQPLNPDVEIYSEDESNTEGQSESG